MPATGIISTGNTYRLFDSSVQTHHSLPVGTYSVQFSPMSGYSLLRVDDLTVGAERIYGGHGAKVDRAMQAYSAMDRSLGVLFTGDKGMGKSLSMRMLAQRAREDLKLPVIKVESDSPDLAEYLDTLGEAVVVFDEFEKVFAMRTEDGNRQDQFLGLFDGVSTTKRMYVVSANNVSDLSDYLVNRPGRFHYHIRHSYPGPDEVREYLRDEVEGITAETVEEIVAFTRKAKINFDHLRAIAFELRLGGSFRDTIGDLNIKRTEDPSYVLNVQFPDNQKTRTVRRLDLFGESNAKFSLTHPDGTELWVEFDPALVYEQGDKLVADPAGVTSEARYYGPDVDEEEVNEKDYVPTSISIDLIGQTTYAY